MTSIRTTLTKKGAMEFKTVCGWRICRGSQTSQTRAQAILAFINQNKCTLPNSKRGQTPGFVRDSRVTGFS
jgi:hypothetical protein